jgi:ligand-binding SRPBCC domain-containing protein
MPRFRRQIVPSYSIVQRFPFSPEVVFDFFRRPSRIVSIAPEDLGLHLLEGPEVMEVGSRIVVQVRRWGVSQRIVTEVVALEDGRSFVEEQRQGPFRAWRHEHRFTALGAAQTEVAERIDYELPGGLLGLMLTAARIEADLARSFAQRVPRVVEILAGLNRG